MVCAAAGLGAQPAAVEITAEPSHHLALQNEYVRVFKVEAAPHATTLTHWHRHDYIYVVFGAAAITNAVEGKAPAQARLLDGEARFVEGNFAHQVTNDAATPFRNLTIEVLKPGKATATAATRGLEIGSGLAVDTVLVKDGIRVRDITLNPGASVPRHTHQGPHLAVAVSELDLRSQTAAGEVRELHLKPGDFSWNPAGMTHTLTNTGKSPARFVTLEFE